VLRTSLLAAAFALIAVPAPRESVAAPADRPLVQPGTPLRVMLLPLKLPGERAAPRRGIERTLRQFTAWYGRVSYGRLRVEAQIAPTFRLSRRDAVKGRVRPSAFQTAISHAQAGGIRFGGALPIFIAASREPLRSYTTKEHVVLLGHHWRENYVWVHEVGHLLGLDHARAPTACPRPFRPVACADRPRNAYEYGDTLDTMGTGPDRFGAYSLAVLGLAPVLDAPAGRARLTIRPLDRPQPTLLRLRAARLDWFVDTRVRGAMRDFPAARLPSGVAISRVVPRYTPGEEVFPRPQRIPATLPQAGCRGTSSCLSRQIFRRGRSLTVRGAFRLRVLRGRGPVRVETTWLDRTPPTVAIARTTVIRRFGTGNEVQLDLRADARGAGVARVEVEQGGVIARVDADDVPGLVAGRRGRGRVRVPLVAGATAARVWLVDAAGNASPPVAVDLTAAASVPAATVDSSPAPGAGPSSAVPLAAGQSVTISGSTDPAFAGVGGRLEAIGHTEDAPSFQVGAGGRFSVTYTPPAAGLFTLRLRVPVERLPDGINFRMQLWEGHFRG
jgi:hypothetical protein